MASASSSASPIKKIDTPDPRNDSPLSTGPSLSPEGLLTWPQNLNAIGVTVQDVHILEIAIKTLRSLLIEGGDGRCPIYKRNTRNFVLKTAQGEEQTLPLPRSLFLFKTTFFISLRDLAAEESKQSRLKGTAYSPENGQMYWKRKVRSIPEGLIIKHIAKRTDTKAREGFAEIAAVFDREPGIDYLEKKYPGTLSDLYRTDQGIALELNALVALKKAFTMLHSSFFSPPSLTESDGAGCSQGIPCFCFHGNISPESIVYELRYIPGLDPIPDLNIVTVEKLRLIGWKGIHNPYYCNKSPGWNPPEFIKYMTLSSHSAQQREIFYCKNGTKKDTWAFGLLALSLLRGGFVFLTPTSAPLPRLSCLVDKIKVRDDGSLDDSEVAQLQQINVDQELDAIFSSLSEQSQQYLWSWWGTICRNLRVNPQLRENLAGSFR